MKKILLFLMILLLVSSLMSVCFAEELPETETAVETAVETMDETNTEPVVDPSEGEDDGKSLRDVLEEWLAKGDAAFAEAEWWAIFSTWVRANLDAILACVGGLAGLIGSLLVLLKTNPQLRAYINSLGTSCKTWFEGILSAMNNVITAVNENKAKNEELAVQVKRQNDAIMLMANAFEDVVKLSGASEAKKDLYIREIEDAKTRIAEGGDISEV